MAMLKLYNTNEERKIARNLRLKERRKNDPVYNKYIWLSNNHSKAIAKHLSWVIKCSICLFEREWYLPEIHHIIPKEEWGKDELNNIISVCAPCHSIIHRQWLWYSYLKEKFLFDIEEYKKSISDLKTIDWHRPEEITLTYTHSNWKTYTKTQKQWAKITWINYRTINSRRKSWWWDNNILSIRSDKNEYMDMEKFL